MTENLERSIEVSGRVAEVSRWPDTCPHCGSEYSEGIGVVVVSGKLRVEGHAHCGLSHPMADPIALVEAPDSNTYTHPAIDPLRKFAHAVQWDSSGQCSECSEWVYLNA